MFNNKVLNKYLVTQQATAFVYKYKEGWCEHIKKIILGFILNRCLTCAKEKILFACRIMYSNTY